MNSHISFTRAKQLNWRFPVSFGWKKADSEEESVFELINPDIEQYPAPSVTDILMELPEGTTLHKYATAYGAWLSGCDKSDMKSTFFISDNPADALATLFV